MDRGKKNVAGEGPEGNDRLVEGESREGNSTGQLGRWPEITGIHFQKNTGTEGAPKSPSRALPYSKISCEADAPS